MKKILKKVGALLLTATMTLPLTACGSGSSDTPDTKKESSVSDTGSDGADSGSSEEQITLTIWHQSVADTDPVKKIIEDSVTEYHELHPNITIEQDGVTGEH